MIDYEKFGFSPDTVKALQRRGHAPREGGTDHRAADGAPVGVPGRTAARPTTAQR